MVFRHKMGDKTTVKMDKKLVKRAHELGLNVSKICENALTKAIQALECTFGEPSSQQKKPSNPSTPNCFTEAGVAESGQRRRLQEPVP